MPGKRKNCKCVNSFMFPHRKEKCALRRVLIRETHAPEAKIQPPPAAMPSPIQITILTADRLCCCTDERNWVHANAKCLAPKQLRWLRRMILQVEETKRSEAKADDGADLGSAVEQFAVPIGVLERIRMRQVRRSVSHVGAGKVETYSQAKQGTSEPASAAELERTEELAPETAAAAVAAFSALALIEGCGDSTTDTTALDAHCGNTDPVALLPSVSDQEAGELYEDEFVVVQVIQEVPNSADPCLPQVAEAPLGSKEAVEVTMEGGNDMNVGANHEEAIEVTVEEPNSVTAGAGDGDDVGGAVEVLTREQLIAELVAAVEWETQVRINDPDGAGADCGADGGEAKIESDGDSDSSVVSRDMCVLGWMRARRHHR